MAMNKNRFMAVFGALAGLSLTTTIVVAQDVGIAASNPGSIYHTTATAVAKMANDKAGLKSTVHPFASATVYLPAVSAGEYGFGITNEDELKLAVTGTGHFKGRVYGDLRAVSLLYPLRVAFFVRKDSGIKSFRDLKGKRLPSGWKAFPMQNHYMIAMLKTVGLTLDDVVGVPVPGLIRAANDFKEGKNDATAIAIVAPKVVELDNAVGGIRFLSLPEGPDALKALQSVHQDFIIVTVKPSKRQVGIEGPTRLFAIDITVTSSTHVADDVVYALTKTAYENKADLVKAHGSFRSFHPKNMVKRSFSIPYHPGAIKFYKEVGLWTEDK